MRSTDAGEESFGGEPEMLTVPEAAHRLRIGRTLANQLAARFLDGQPGGIPAIRLGGSLRVPRTALDEFMRFGRVATRDELTAAATAVLDDYLGDAAAIGAREPPPNRQRRTTNAGTAQLSLLESD